MIAAKIAGIFCIVLVGYVSNKIGWLPIEASKYFSSALINLAAPCVTVMAFSAQETSPENNKSIAIVLLIMALGAVASWFIALLFNRLMRVPECEKGVYSNFLIFTNNGNMGIAVAMTIFRGPQLFLFILMGLVSLPLLYTLGVANVKRDAAARSGVPRERAPVSRMLKEAINAPVVSCAVGVLIYAFQVPVPEAIGNVLNMIGSMMTPLAMLLIGLQLADSNPRAIMGNVRIVVMAALRLVGIPFVFLVFMLLFHVPAPLVAICVLGFLLPPAVVPVALAGEYGGDAKLAAEGTFFGTLFSVVTVPIASMLITHML